MPSSVPGTIQAGDNITLKKQNSVTGGWAKAIHGHVESEDGKETYGKCNKVLAFFEWVPIVNFL